MQEKYIEGKTKYSYPLFINLNGRVMSIEDYEQQMAEQFKYLDQIDIEKYMNNCTTGKVRELIFAIERDYDNTEFTDNDFLQ